MTHATETKPKSERTMLIARYDCGCMMAALVDDLANDRDRRDFYRQAGKEGCSVERHKGAVDFPWLCPEHAAEDAAKKRQAGLFRATDGREPR